MINIELLPSSMKKRKEALQTLAWRSGRSMAKYFRYPIIEAIAIARSD